jgi:2-phosphoglycerate kinase
VKYIIDDTHIVPDYIKEMSDEELEAVLEKFHEEERLKRLMRKKTSAHDKRQYPAVSA